jgi:hypothetical protein
MAVDRRPAERAGRTLRVRVLLDRALCLSPSSCLAERKESDAALQERVSSAFSQARSFPAPPFVASIRIIGWRA